MTKTMAVGLLGLALCGLAGTDARAQTVATDATVKPLTVKLGVLLPTNGNLKRDVGNTWFSAGAEYTFNQSGDTGSFLRNPQQNVLPLVYLDYAGISKSGQKASLVGLGLGLRYYVSPPNVESTVTPYLSAGVGAYYTHASGFSSSINKTQAGLRLGLGVEIQQMYVLEAAYTNAGSANGVKFDGVNIQAGVRF